MSHFVCDKVGDRIGEQINYSCMTVHVSMTDFHKYTAKTGGIC